MKRRTIRRTNGKFEWRKRTSPCGMFTYWGWWVLAPRKRGGSK